MVLFKTLQGVELLVPIRRVWISGCKLSALETQRFGQAEQENGKHKQRDFPVEHNAKRACQNTEICGDDAHTTESI